MIHPARPSKLSARIDIVSDDDIFATPVPVENLQSVENKEYNNLNQSTKTYREDSSNMTHEKTTPQPRVHQLQSCQDLLDDHALADLDAAKVLLAMFDSNIAVVNDSPGSIDGYFVGKLFPCNLREMWDLVNKQAQQRGHCVRQGKGSKLRDIPKGNRLVLECTRAGFTEKQLKDFRDADGADSDDAFEIQKKRKFTKKPLASSTYAACSVPLNGNDFQKNEKLGEKQKRTSSSYRCGCERRLKFDPQCSHVSLGDFCCDEEVGKFVRIATLDQQLHLTKQDQLFTFMALKQWLETKANHKLLVLEHALESGKMFGLFSPRITIKIPSMRKLAQV